MMDFLSNLIGLVVAVGLILSALVIMFSPHKGSEMFKRIAVLTVGAFAGLSVLGCFLVSLRFRLLVFVFLVAVSFVAYLIREARRPRDYRQAGHVGGAERTPVLPYHLDGDNV
jgi:hypothetical protein